MLSDVGLPELKTKCLDVIRELNLEAQILLQEQIDELGGDELKVKQKKEQIKKNREGSVVMAKIEN